MVDNTFVFVIKALAFKFGYSSLYCKNAERKFEILQPIQEDKLSVLIKDLIIRSHSTSHF